MSTSRERPHRSLVTIVVPTYNQADYLASAIESALTQSYEHMEVLVADDASPDDTASVVARFAHDPRVRYERNQRNLGRVGNYRHALYTLARGDYVLNLDGDDWLTDSSYVARAVDLLDSEPDVALVFANAWSYREETGEFSRRADQNNNLSRVNDGNEVFLRYADASVWIPHLTAVYRRKVALEVGFYVLDTIGSDTDSLLRILLDRHVGFIDAPVAAWRLHGINATRSLDLQERLANLDCVERPYEAALASTRIRTGSLKRWRRRMLSRLCLDFLQSAVGARAYSTAAQFFARVISRRPVVGVTVVRDGATRAIEMLGSRHRPSETLRLDRDHQ